MTDLDAPTLGGTLPYYGSKRGQAAAIVRELGSAHRGFCELTAGSLAVTLAKDPVSMEVVNDLYGDVVNVTRVLASVRWRELHERIDRTLMAYPLHEEAKGRTAGPCPVAPSIDDVGDEHLDRAYWFLLHSWQGINGVTGTGRGNMQVARRFTVGGGHGAQRWQGVADSIPFWHRRLKDVLIDQMDCCDLASRLADDGTWCIYADPPYIVKGDNYVHDFTPEKHAELAAVLSAKKRTRVVVSYYDHPEVRRLYRVGEPGGWTLVDMAKTKALVNQGMRDVEPGSAKVIAPEILLINGESYTQAGGLFG